MVFLSLTTYSKSAAVGESAFAAEEVPTKLTTVLSVEFPRDVVDNGPDLTVNKGAVDLNERSILLVRAAVASGLSGLGVGAE